MVTPATLVDPSGSGIGAMVQYRVYIGVVVFGVVTPTGVSAARTAAGNSVSAWSTIAEAIGSTENEFIAPAMSVMSVSLLVFVFAKSPVGAVPLEVYCKLASTPVSSWASAAASASRVLVAIRPAAI